MNGTAKGYGAGHIDISVLQCDWGDASRMDIQRLLQDTASHISREVRSAFYGRIEVVRFPGSKNPMTRFRVSAKDPFCIELSVRDRKWNQYAYQFAHEFCHVLSGYENLRDNPNNWFHESICELASLFTLRKMADRWLAAAPYPNWADYSPHLKNYAFNIIAHTKEYAPPDSEFINWLMSEEEELRNDARLRKKNAVVACRLLPLFEEQAQGWNAITALPPSTARIAEYLADWKSLASSADKPFVEHVIKRLVPA